MVVTLDAKRRLTVPAALAPGQAGRLLRRALRCGGRRHCVPAPLWRGELAGRIEGVSRQPGRCASQKARPVQAAEAMSWLLDTDVICQPAKKSGDAKVIAWLEAEQDRCYTSAVFIVQLAYCVRT